MSSPADSPLPAYETHPFRHRYTLYDVYEAARTHPNFDYTFWLHIVLDIIGQYAMRAFGYVLIVVGFSLLTFLGFMGLKFVIPDLYENGHISHTIPHYGLGIFFLFNIYFNYILAITRKAGTPTEVMSAEELSKITSTCKKCNLQKPKRTHHCSVCDRCILKMDHHCPWLNNCIGLRNYRFFLLFLLYTHLGTGYLTYMSYPLAIGPNSHMLDQIKNDIYNAYSKSFQDVRTTISYIPELFHSWKGDNTEKLQLSGIANANTNLRGYQVQTIDFTAKDIENTENETRRKLTNKIRKTLPVFQNYLSNDETVYFMVFSFSIGVCIGTAFLLYFHLFLAYTGQTTLEFFESNVFAERIKKNAEQNNTAYNLRPFDRGPMQNLELIFGTKNILIAILPRLNVTIVDEFKYRIPTTLHLQYPQNNNTNSNNAGSLVSQVNKQSSCYSYCNCKAAVKSYCGIVPIYQFISSKCIKSKKLKDEKEMISAADVDFFV